MDCGSIYIKMCEKAKEIQELVKGKDELGHPNDAAYTGLTWILVGDRIYTRCADWERNTYIWVWMPRCHHFWEMLKPSLSFRERLRYLVTNKAQTIYGFKNGENLIFPIGILTPNMVDKSEEQLWLAFVMLERFGKIWTGLEWAKKA